MNKALYVDSVSSVAGAFIGTSTIVPPAAATRRVMSICIYWGPSGMVAGEAIIISITNGFLYGLLFLFFFSGLGTARATACADIVLPLYHLHRRDRAEQ